MNTFSNANVISDNTKRILAAMPATPPPTPSNPTVPTVPTTPPEKGGKKDEDKKVSKILLGTAVKSGKFSYKGKGVYKEADTDTNIGRVWIKKEVIDDVTGEKQEWLVAYTNEEEDFARSLATKRLRMPKVLSGAGAGELIQSVERTGQELNRYPVDESQMVTNAGDAVAYAYLGNKYEIVTWNEGAQEHTAGEQNIANLGPMQASLKKNSYGPQEMGDMDMRNELRGEWGLDEACPECGGPMEGTSDEMFHCEHCNTSYDALDLEEMKMKGQESDRFEGYASRARRFEKHTFQRKVAYDDNNPDDYMSPDKFKAAPDNFGVSDIKQGYESIEQSLEEGPTDNPFDIASSDEPAFDGGGTQIQMGSIVRNEFDKEGSVADILSPMKVTVSWFDKNYGEGERGDTIAPNDIRVVGAKDNTKVKRFYLSASNEQGDYCVVCRKGKKFAGEYGNINSPDTFNDPQLMETVKLGGKDSARKWFLGKLANKGLTMDRFHLGANPYVNAHEFAILMSSNGETQHTLAKVAGRGIYSLYTEIEGEADTKPISGGKIVWMRDFIVPEGESIYGTDKFLAYIEKGNGVVSAMIQTADGQELSGDTFPNEFAAQKFIMSEIAAMKDNASVWSATASVSASLKSLRKKAMDEGGQFAPVDIYKPDYGVKGEIIWSRPFMIEGGTEFYGTDRFEAYIEKSEDGYGAVIDSAKDGQTVSGDVFTDENAAHKFLAAEIAAMKDNTSWWNTEAHISDALRQLRKIGGQPKPEDIPIAPGIKSKNITLDESGAQGTAKVTVDFTDVEQGLKFYQDQVTTAPPAPAPAATPAPAEGTPPAPGTPPAATPKPAGPPTPVASSLKFAAEGDEPGEFMGEKFDNSNLSDEDPEDVQVGSIEWIKKTIEDADKYFMATRKQPDTTDYIDFIYGASEDQAGYCDEECAQGYWNKYQEHLRSIR